jgi:hypothetical protein
MRGKLILAGLIGALIVVTSALGGAPTTITVTSTNDIGVSGICVLRDAITAANTGDGVNGCDSGPSPYAIVFQSGLTGTITLASSLPPVTSNLTITGPTSI